jgi:hypothetical protein
MRSWMLQDLVELFLDAEAHCFISQSGTLSAHDAMERCVL